MADDLQEWYEAGTADGFTIMPADTAVDLENFATLVVPILQQRGLFQRDYTSPTLRAHPAVTAGLAAWARPEVRTDALDALFGLLPLR
ncbi:MAG: hypothetical protein WAW17_09590 [Rhodococcus sp. (in: high G+C Gram-positive bacteria)]|uniref:hypothetical protein n=1 Tax=Rhodococcus sp. TaxID=1831 RepID=UPI003BB1FF09